jgi:hypothetical protein
VNINVNFIFLDIKYSICYKKKSKRLGFFLFIVIRNNVDSSSVLTTLSYIALKNYLGSKGKVVFSKGIQILFVYWVGAI